MRRSTCKVNSIWTGGLLALVLIVALPARAVPAMSPASTTPQEKLLTLNFVEADIVDVVKALATQSGANVVVAGSVSGKQITLSLSGVTLEQALRLVTQPNGLDYRRIDGTYVVAPPADLANYGAAGPDAARPTTQVVVLKRVTPTNATKMLADAMPTVQVAQGPADGTLLLTGLPLDVVEAVALINAADVEPGIGATEFEVYEIRYAEPVELQEKVAMLVPDIQVMLGPKTITPMVMDPSTRGGSTSWLRGPMAVGGGGLGTTTAGVGGGAGAEVSPVTTLILAGPPDAIARAKNLLATIDLAPPMISIAALITEGNVSDISRKGVDWIGLGENATSISLTEATPDHWYQLGRISRSGFNIAATLRALINDNKLRVLSRPNIVVLNGRQATLHSGQTVYYRKQIGIDDTGRPIYDIEQIPVGVTLVINPRLAADGDIILTLQPIVSSLSDNTYFPDLPLVSEHRTLTTVRIKQGEVLVIAGLMRDSEEIIRSRVPLLGDLPIIGRMLFSHKEKRRISTELMIFIEPVPVQYPTDVEVMKPAE